MESGETEVSETEPTAEEESGEAAAPETGVEGEVESGEKNSEEGALGAADKLEARLAQLTGGPVPNGSSDGDEVPSAREVSATTIGRMMGLATASELKLMEGKLDLLSTRVNNMTVRMEKIISILSGAPSGSDLERIDMQIGSLRTMLREAFQQKDAYGAPAKEMPGPGEKGDRPITGAKIVTNTEE